ncbi:DUF6538 domain-containing protein [Sphingomonas sp. R647]|uniref:DUF6538 domain-containing protein n=1 Tax=Sphingomonas sp. R647 TaxID=2875233 RepID=UPI0039904BFE
MSHRWPSDIWRRGAMYQCRVRVPSDLRQVIGSSHISRSLGTASLTVARRSLLQDICSLARESEVLFPALHLTERPLSDNTLNVALRRLGF